MIYKAELLRQSATWQINLDEAWLDLEVASQIMKVQIQQFFFLIPNGTCALVISTSDKTYPEKKNYSKARLM